MDLCCQNLNLLHPTIRRYFRSFRRQGMSILLIICLIGVCLSWFPNEPQSLILLSRIILPHTTSIPLDFPTKTPPSGSRVFMKGVARPYSEHGGKKVVRALYLLSSVLEIHRQSAINIPTSRSYTTYKPSMNTRDCIPRILDHSGE